MSNEVDVIIPTFLNCHIFWILEKKNLLFRVAMGKLLNKSNYHKEIKIINPFLEDEMVAVKVDGQWVRAIIKEITENDFSPSSKPIGASNYRFLCWLPDYAVMRVVQNIFYLPDDLKKWPHLTRQASLHNVVNLTMEVALGDVGFEFKVTKTTQHVEGVKKIALECIENADALWFTIDDQDEFNVYGDIKFLDKKGDTESLTDVLIKKELMSHDSTMFKDMDVTRDYFKNSYFNKSQSINQPLDKSELKYHSEIKSYDDINKRFPAMELFKRALYCSRKSS